MMSQRSKNGLFQQMSERCLYANEQGHSISINVATVSPDGTLGASGGKDGVVRLWDTSDGHRLYSLDAGDVVHSLCFSHTQFWLCVATQRGIKIWDLETKVVQDELPLRLDDKRNARPHCNGLSWSRDGRTLYACYTDGVIRVWKAV